MLSLSVSINARSSSRDPWADKISTDQGASACRPIVKVGHELLNRVEVLQTCRARSAINKYATFVAKSGFMAAVFSILLLAASCSLLMRVVDVLWSSLAIEDLALYCKPLTVQLFTDEGSGCSLVIMMGR